MNQTDQAVKLWKRVVKDLPRSPWAKTAKERLAAIK
jgi:TolA-binding protein